MIRSATDVVAHGRRTGWLALLLVLSLAVACRRSAPASAAAVAVVEVSPTPIVVREGQPNTIMIRGTGFHATTNTVTVGPITVDSVKSRRAGTEIVLSLPDRVPSGGGAAPMLWSTGQYVLTVANVHGISAPLMIAIQEPQ